MKDQFHEYARHTFQRLITYHAFHITLNFATLGRLAGKAKPTERARPLLTLVAWLFILMNVQGGLGYIFVFLYYWTLPDLGAEGMPIHLYRVAIALMIITMAALAAAWTRVPGSLGQSPPLTVYARRRAQRYLTAWSQRVRKSAKRATASAYGHPTTHRFPGEVSRSARRVARPSSILATRESHARRAGEPRAISRP